MTKKKKTRPFIFEINEEKDDLVVMQPARGKTGWGHQWTDTKYYVSLTRANCATTERITLNSDPEKIICDNLEGRRLTLMQWVRRQIKAGHGHTEKEIFRVGV